MSTNYTANIGLGEPGSLDTAWPTTLNNNWSLLDTIGSIGPLGVTYTEYPSATLNLRIAAGTFIASTGLYVTYAGISSTSVGANVTTSLWLTDAGVLASATTGFPVANIVPLATVVSGGSSITSITDARRPFKSGGANLNTAYLPLSGGTVTAPITFSGTGNNAGIIFQPVTIPSAPVEGQTADDNVQLALYSFVGSQAGWIVRNIFSQTQAVNFNTTSAATTLLGTGKGSVVIQANSLATGKILRIRAQGFFPTTKTATPGTFNFILAIGSVTVATLTTAPTLGNSLTNGGWSLEADIKVVSTGSGTSATVLTHGKVFLPVTNADPQTMGCFALVNAAASSGFNSTTNNSFNLSGQFSVNDATNSVTCTSVQIDEAA